MATSGTSKTTSTAKSADTTTTADPNVVVTDNSTDLPKDTAAAASEAQSTEPDGQLHDVDPASHPGDNLAPGATLADNPANLPAAGTGFHCGYCGQPIGSEGQHYDGNGNQVAVPHAGTLVVANDWGTRQTQESADSARAELTEQTSASNEAKTENTK